MNAQQIEIALNSSKYFKGVFSIDNLPVILKNQKGIYIVNTDVENGIGK